MSPRARKPACCPALRNMGWLSCRGTIGTAIEDHRLPGLWEVGGGGGAPCRESPPPRRSCGVLRARMAGIHSHAVRTACHRVPAAPGAPSPAPWALKCATTLRANRGRGQGLQCRGCAPSDTKRACAPSRRACGVKTRSPATTRLDGSAHSCRTAAVFIAHVAGVVAPADTIPHTTTSVAGWCPVLPAAGPHCGSALS